MNVFYRDDLEKLMDENDSPCVSIFLPTHRSGVEIQQDQIRFKNLLSKAEEGLLKNGIRTTEAKEFLLPARKLLLEGLFWQHQSDGLAIFLCKEMLSCYRIPLDFSELVIVTDHFHTKPLLPLLSGDGRFYILALSQNQIRLFQGSRFSVDEVHIEGIPKYATETLRHENPKKQIQFHTGTAGGAGGRIGIFHGQGMGANDKKADILKFFRKIDKALHKFIRNENVPLVVAGVEYLFPIYREANTHPHLLKQGISGNPEGLSPMELHEQAWRIVQLYFQKEQRDAMDQYRQFAGTEKVSTNVKKIVPSAYHGGISLLFVAVGVHIWGTFDPDSNAVQIHEAAESGDNDLLNFAAIQTFLHGGTVYVVRPDEVPDDSPLAAIFRY